MLIFDMPPYFSGSGLFALHYAGVTIDSFTFKVIGGSLRAFIETALEISRNIRVERIRRQIRPQRSVTKMLVHPSAR
jgi:hypothetical protein